MLQNVFILYGSRDRSALHYFTTETLAKLATFVTSLVAKIFFYSPWRPKQSQLGALSVFTAAMLEEPNNKRYLQKNKICAPKENHCIVWLLQHGRRENTLYTEYAIFWGSFGGKIARGPPGISSTIRACFRRRLALREAPRCQQDKQSLSSSFLVCFLFLFLYRLSVRILRNKPTNFFFLPVLLYDIIVNLQYTTLHYYNLLTLLYRKICLIAVLISPQTCSYRQ